MVPQQGVKHWQHLGAQHVVNSSTPAGGPTPGQQEDQNNPAGGPIVPQQGGQHMVSKRPKVPSRRPTGPTRGPTPGQQEVQ
jgi:hypothetical protein